MKKFNNLLEKNENDISVEEFNFIQLHKELIYCSSQAVNYFIETCKKLKVMRDNKIYLVAGFKNFGDYTENALCLKERQAYNYISVYENLPSDFLQSNAKLGVTKLSLIASLEPEDRKDLMEKVSIENSTVKELKIEVENYKKRNEQLSMDLDSANSELTKLQEEVNTGNKEEVEKLKKKLEAVKKQASSKNDEINNLKNQIEELKNAPKEVKEIDNPDLVARLKSSNRDKEELAKKIAKLEKQIEMRGADENMAKFKVKFKDFQLNLNELLSLLGLISDDKKEKCKIAIKKVLEGVKL